LELDKKIISFFIMKIIYKHYCNTVYIITNNLGGLLTREKQRDEGRVGKHVQFNFNGKNM